MIKNKDIETSKPQMGNIDKTAGTVMATNTTYNQNTVTYSSTSQTYGGITGAKFGIKPQMQDVINI